VIDSFHNEYRFLSNFYPCVVEFEDMFYQSTEHAYQAAKTVDHLERVRVRECPSPGSAKRMGRTVTLRPDWEDVKLAIMEHLLLEKFDDPELKGRLLDTGEEVLVEGNTWHDNYFGICSCGRCSPETTGIADIGENHLGRLLMKVRTAIREGRA
jgi:ribA/ribD-fused uncharacterized protein